MPSRRVDANDHEALPVFALALQFGPHLAQEALLELQDLADVHAHDQRFGGGHGPVDQQHVIEFVLGGRQDAGALVDLGGIDQVEHGEVLDIQDFIHAFEAEAALAVEEVGDVSLLETGLLGEAQSGEVAFVNPVPEGFAQIFLQGLEFHAGSITRAYSEVIFIRKIATSERK